MEAVASYVNDWPKWWAEQSPFSRIFPAVAVGAWWFVWHLMGGFHADHVQIGLAVLVLSYGGRGTRVLMRFLLPVVLTAIIYDSQRFYSDYIRGPIHVSQPYNFDKRFFGITTAAGVLTPNEWFQLHTHPVLDFITGFFYLTFVAMFVAIAAYFQLWLKRERASELMWGFLWLNLLGYSTYYWYAAAPPWYVAAYGLGPANMSAQASAAGCLRFDQLLGTHFFTGMYGRAADVFGAIPSLHIAYPLLAVCYAFRFGALRVFSLIFFTVMCFSAVYLNHHYVLDLLWGASYALLIAWVMTSYGNRKHRGVSARTQTI